MIVSRPTTFEMLLRHRTHDTPDLFRCSDCLQFTEAHEEELNRELDDITPQQFAKMMMDPLVWETISAHVKRAFEHQRRVAELRTETAEARIEELRFDKQCEALINACSTDREQ